ncbi:MAG: GHKL domain-containing protein [Desulfitobacteriaceae bacterium]
MGIIFGSASHLIRQVTGSYINCSREHVMDLVSILGNILDNALEAVQDLDQPERLVSIHSGRIPWNISLK